MTLPANKCVHVQCACVPYACNAYAQADGSVLDGEASGHLADRLPYIYLQTATNDQTVNCWMDWLSVRS